MIILYLRADTEDGLKAALPWALSPDGEWVMASHRYDLDLIGRMMLSPPAMDAAGTVTAEAEFDPGYHANLTLLDPALEPLVPADVRIAVTNPLRVWA